MGIVGHFSTYCCFLVPVVQVPFREQVDKLLANHEGQLSMKIKFDCGFTHMASDDHVFNIFALSYTLCAT